MAKLASILQQRFRKKEKPKMTELAEKTAEGQLTVFSGIFRVGKLDDKQREELVSLLHRFSLEENPDLSQDLNSLIAITAEVRAINNQAAILHGERIKQAQTILKNYRDGAFTAWLTATYGNRQTPYNFLQYYEFYSKIPSSLQPMVESMPRQAVYTLASRQGELSKKEEIVRNYQGETKQQMISMIRSAFPLEHHDRRREDIGETTLKALQRLLILFESSQVHMSEKQKHAIQTLLYKLGSLVDMSSSRLSIGE